MYIAIVVVYFIVALFYYTLMFWVMPGKAVFRRAGKETLLLKSHVITMLLLPIVMILGVLVYIVEESRKSLVRIKAAIKETYNAHKEMINDFNIKRSIASRTSISLYLPEFSYNEEKEFKYFPKLDEFYILDGDLYNLIDDEQLSDLTTQLINKYYDDAVIFLNFLKENNIYGFNNRAIDYPSSASE